MSMSVKQFVSRTYQKFGSWNLSTEPLPEKAIIIGAPHTSNWDAFFMLMALWNENRSFKFLVKNSMNRGPVGYITRALGGVGVDRGASHGLVPAIIAKAQAADEFLLCITPKGTRSPRQYWKSGFYSIALGADLPIVFGFLDSTTRTYGWGPTYKLTGDVKADMDVIRAFYDGKKGVKPELGSKPRLRAEDE